MNGSAVNEKLQSQIGRQQERMNDQQEQLDRAMQILAELMEQVKEGKIIKPGYDVSRIK